MNTISEYINALNERFNEFDLQHERIMIQMRFMSEIERLMEENDFSEKKLAELSGLSASFITQLFKGNKKLNLDTIAKFQMIFDVKFKIEAKIEAEFFSDDFQEMQELRQLRIVKYKPSGEDNFQIAV